MNITPRACALGLAAALTLLTSPHASAQTNTWNGGGTNGNWTEGSNWVGGVAPVANGSLIFAGSTRTDATNDFAAGTVFNLIRFDGAASPFTLSGNRIGVGAANDISGNIRWDGLPGVITQTISADLDLSVGGAGTRSFNVAPDATLLLSGTISGSGAWQKLGLGTLSLTGPNTVTGIVTIQTGTVQISSLGDDGVSSALGAGGSFRVGTAANTATLSLVGSSSAQSSDRQLIVGSGGTTGSTGGAIIRNDNANSAHTLTFVNSTFNVPVGTGGANATRTITLGGTNTGNNTIEGSIIDQNATTGIIAVTKADAGTWILAGSNTYTGPTTVSNGTLRLAPTGLINSNSAVTVAATGTLGGAGTIGGTLTVDGNLFAGNWDTNAATLTVQGAVTNTGSSLVSFRAFGNNTNDSLTAPAGANISGTVQVSFESPYAGASGDSFDFVIGPISGTPTNFILPSLATNLAWVTNDWTNTGILSITNVAGPTNAYNQWLTNYPSLTNTNVAADPELDGFNNGTEFAFDGDPTVGTPALIFAAKSGTNVVVSFVANTNVAAVTYDVQSTTNLTAGPWTNNPALTAAITNSADQSGLLLPAFYERREFSVGIATNEFYRVRATILP